MAQISKTTTTKTTAAAYTKKNIEVGELVIDELGVKIGVGSGYLNTPYLSKNLASSKNRMELIAHRGFVKSYPQNTMLAFTSAIDSGADSLEFDVQISLDGVAVVFHDTTVDALTDGVGEVSSLTFAQLQSLKFTTLTGTIAESANIPLLSDVLNYAKSSGVKVYPEIKGYRSQEDIKIIIDDIIESGMQFDSYIQSFLLSDLQYFRSLDYIVNLGLLGASIDASTYESNVNDVALLGDGFIYWSATSLLSNALIVDYAKSKNLDVAAWTVDSNDQAKELMKIGVNKIMSNINLRVI